jgi:hypothetical protein
MDRSCRVIRGRAARCNSVGQNDGRTTAPELRGHRELGKHRQVDRYAALARVRGHGD